MNNLIVVLVLTLGLVGCKSTSGGLFSPELVTYSGKPVIKDFTIKMVAVSDKGTTKPITVIGKCDFDGWSHDYKINAYYYDRSHKRDRPIKLDRYVVYGLGSYEEILSGGSFELSEKRGSKLFIQRVIKFDVQGNPLQELTAACDIESAKRKADNIEAKRIRAESAAIAHKIKVANYNEARDIRRLANEKLIWKQTAHRGRIYQDVYNFEEVVSYIRSRTMDKGTAFVVDINIEDSYKVAQIVADGYRFEDNSKFRGRTGVLLKTNETMFNGEELRKLGKIVIVYEGMSKYGTVTGAGRQIAIFKHLPFIEE